MTPTDPASATQHPTDALSWILREDASEFIRETLDRSTRLIRGGDATRFGELLSLDVVDSILGGFGLSVEEIRVVQHDRDIGVSDYAWRGMADPMRITQLFADGATIIFNALQNRHEPLRLLCSTLSAQAAARTQTNVYLTPPRSQGFKPHWDTHDVFVLQVEGSKRWRLYSGGEDRPLAGRRFDPDEHEAGSIESETTLEGGDALYIPRGVMHAAASRDDTSLHITLGLIPYTWVEFVAECLAELALRRGEWRDSLPFGFDREQIDTELRRRLAQMDLDLDAVLTAKRDAIADAFRPRAADYLSQGLLSPLPDHNVRLRPGLASRMEFRDDRCVLVSQGRELDFPRIAERTIELLLTGRAFRAGAIDDGLDWQGRRVVLSSLLRAGIVQAL